ILSNQKELILYDEVVSFAILFGRVLLLASLERLVIVYIKQSRRKNKNFSLSSVSSMSKGRSMPNSFPLCIFDPHFGSPN
ncbi:hypothetical protein, partial [Thermanaerothrix sp.]|uniref:hypothetical protein n=1 Tax=Thermanaerothrix sp. TaxID=2972675 RepID=UPI003C7DC497